MTCSRCDPNPLATAFGADMRLCGCSHCIKQVTRGFHLTCRACLNLLSEQSLWSKTGVSHYQQN